MDIGSTEFRTGVQTTTYGYNGSFLGPTLIMQSGEAVQMHVTNHLNETTTTHWHGMHVAPEHDGGPHTLIAVGATWSPAFIVRDTASTMWYHPHLHGKTNEHVTFGLTGMIFVRDEVEAVAGLPMTYGVDEFPLVLQDRNLSPDGQLAVAALGNTILVNGTPDPYLAVPAQMVRLRMVNGSPGRAFNVGLSTNAAFQLIGTDGGLLESPLPVTRMLLLPGERADIVVDLTSLNGSTFDLTSYNSEFIGNDLPGAAGGGGNAPFEGEDFSLLELRVGAATAAPVTQLPDSILTLDRITEDEATVTRTLRMTVAGPGAPFLIDGVAFDHDVVNQSVELGTTEIWEIVNQTNAAHPFHIHDVQFFVLDIDGEPPPPEWSGKKDTIVVRSGSTVRFIAKFEDFSNSTIPYMYHCHLLAHEDAGMMGQFKVLPSTETAGLELIGAARVINMATRARIGGIAGTPIAGFVLRGPGGKQMLVRGIGPGLKPFKVPNILADPDLRLVSQSITLKTNDAWVTEDAAVFARLGAFALTVDSEDSAMVTNLDQGLYTTPVGDGGAEGVMLLELYDADGAIDGANLVNASARAYVGTADDVLIPSVVIGGEGTVKLLVRAIGPTLAELDVDGVLANPEMTLYSGATALATNDDWGDSANAAEIAAAAAAVGAFALDPASADASMLVELAAGAYTIIVCGVGDTTGTALVELYLIP